MSELRSDPETSSEIKEEFSDAAAILRKPEDLKFLRREIYRSKHPLVNLISLTEKGTRIVKLLANLEDLMKPYDS
ncbi:MAG: hypothetical protein ACYDAP_13435 [Thermoplasmataceae archaeon]